MMFPIFLPIFVIVLGFIAYKRRQQTREQNQLNEDFLTKEVEANSTRRKDISTLSYLNFTTEALPLGQFNDPVLANCEHLILTLQKRRIINLSSYTNTQLKLLYGPANLKELSEYDDNFTLLEKTLLLYGKQQMLLERNEEALAIFQFCTTIHCDITEIYTLLAQLYLNEERIEEVKDLAYTISLWEETFAASLSQKLWSILP